MSHEKKQILIDSYLQRTEREGRLEEGRETIARLTANFELVRQQAAADQPLVQAFLAAHGTEPQAIRATNTIAKRWGGWSARDASVTHEAPARVQ